MTASRTLSRIIELLAGEKAALRHAEARYKANRRAGFVAHNKQRLSEEQVRRNTRNGHPKLAERQLDLARTFSHHAHRDHLRAQHFFAETRRIAHHIHKLELERGKLEHHGTAAEIMFDSVTVSEIPEKAPAVAGYTGGLYRTMPELVRKFPHANHLPIAVSAADKGRCLDIESGDATPYQFPTWLRRELKAAPSGAAKHMGYASVSAWPEIRSLAESHGFPRERYLVFTAHYTDEPHICGPHTCGELAWDADLTQWTPAALGKNLDESRLTAGVFA